LGGRKGIRPVKKQSGGLLALLSVELGADLHMAQLMPLPLTVSCFNKIQIVFTFLVPADPSSPGKRAVKRVCVYVCLCCSVFQFLPEYSKMGKKRPGQGAGAKYLKLGLIIGSLLYGVSKIHCAVVVMLPILSE